MPCQEAMAASGLEVLVDEVRLVLLPITLAEQDVDLLLALVGASLGELCADHGLSRRLFLPLNPRLLTDLAARFAEVL